MNKIDHDSTIKKLEMRILAIERRNRRVELDKAWETSLARKVTIIIVTYFVVLAFMIVIENDRPFTNAIVPSIGFFLSTLAVTVLKRLWMKGE